MAAPMSMMLGKSKARTMLNKASLVIINTPYGFSFKMRNHVSNDIGDKHEG